MELVLYIITEDSNSARVFWDLVIKEYISSDNYVLVPLLKKQNGTRVGGNTTLGNEIRR